MEIYNSALRSAKWADGRAMGYLVDVIRGVMSVTKSSHFPHSYLIQSKLSIGMQPNFEGKGRGGKERKGKLDPGPGAPLFFSFGRRKREVKGE